MLRTIKNNLLAGYRISPLQEWKFSLALMTIFGGIAVAVGSAGSLYQLEMLQSRMMYFLPFSLFLFPAFLEESFFRGILIPHNTKEKGPAAGLLFTLLSAALFTAWHPLNALTVNPGASELFLNPSFLAIAFCLGIVCSLSYIRSRSLWTPIIMHWLVIWVLFLGGRNLILE
ncbi:MAG: type II CAAX prenyl endopeptidase Rce1 family protein [Candidatus Electrothrix sp. YB6]